MSDARNHPTMRMMAKPMIFGIAARKIAIAWLIDVRKASPHDWTGTGSIVIPSGLRFVGQPLPYKKVPLSGDAVIKT
jgi:hypothetical protein